MLTYFQLKKNNNTFIVSYIFNDKALCYKFLSLWIQSGGGQIALGCAIWCLGDLTCDQGYHQPPPVCSFDV